MIISIKDVNKKLVFENGQVFEGTGFGANVERICEVVFNTAMAGYQEIFSDCSCNEQFVCMTYPLIGNYGLAADDYESRTPKIGGFIVREYNDSLSNFRAAKTLSEEMEENGIPGIEGVDTRKITRMIRNEGTMRAMMCDIGKDTAEALEQLKATPLCHEQVKNVSCRKRWYSRTAGMMYNVVVVDCGVKLSIIDSLVQRHCNVTVLPYNTTAEQIYALSPDGVVLSNGPGDPRDVPEVVSLVKELQGKLPLFGICLGHQMIALANGCEIYKLKFGHRGANHPVQNLATGKIEMTSQNHSYAVKAESVEGTKLKITHVDILDNTVEGLANDKQFVFSVQFHPEISSGQQSSTGLFGKFIKNMESFKNKGALR